MIIFGEPIIPKKPNVTDNESDAFNESSLHLDFNHKSSSEFAEDSPNEATEAPSNQAKDAPNNETANFKKTPCKKFGN